MWRDPPSSDKLGGFILELGGVTKAVFSARGARRELGGTLRSKLGPSVPSFAKGGRRLMPPVNDSAKASKAPKPAEITCQRILGASGSLRNRRTDERSQEDEIVVGKTALCFGFVVRPDYAQCKHN